MRNSIYSTYNKTFTQLYAEVEKSVTKDTKDTTSLRFKNGKAYAHRGTSGLSMISRIIKKRRFAKALHRSIENQFGREVADTLMAPVMRNGKIKLTADIQLCELREINEILKTHKQTSERHEQNTSLRMGQGVQRASYSEAQIKDIQKDINAAACGNVGNSSKQKKEGANEGLFGSFVDDFGRATYKLDDETLAGMSLQKPAEDQCADCSKTLKQKIPDDKLREDFEKIGSILHQGVFGSRLTAAVSNPQSNHPMPFLVGDPTNNTRLGSVFEVFTTDQPGVYRFTATSDTSIANVQDFSDPKTAPMDRLREDQSYATTVFQGTINLTESHKDAPVKLDNVKFEYKAEFKPRSEDE